MSVQIVFNVSNSWPRATRAMLLPVLLLSLPPAQSMASPEAYGMHFVRIDEQVPGEPQTGEPYSHISSQQDLTPYRAQLEEMELRDGAYADALAEPLAAIGRAHRQQGAHEQALAAYRRALHIVRVNDGLYSDRQIPVLREMLLTFRESGDFEALDGRYEYLFRLYGMGQPPYTPMRLQVAVEYLRWQREALLRGLSGSEERRMLDLVALNEALVQQVMDDPAAPWPWKRDLVRSQVANFYLLLEHFEPPPHESQLVASYDPFGAKPMVADLRDQRMDTLLRGAGAKGRRLLEALREAAAGQGVIEEAALDLALADWHLWNGDRQRARDSYERAATRLESAGELAQLQAWMGEPVELPDNGAFLRPEPIPEKGGNTVRARFDVTETGRVHVHDAEPLGEETSANLTRFRRKLAGTLFRPRWEGGETRASRNVERDYRLLD